MSERRPSASLIVALIALVLALGGVGYAAIYLPPGSVGTAQLRPGAVTNSKLGNGSVGNRKLRFGAVGSRKIENGAVGRGQINPNQVQARVSGLCDVGALTSISSKGAVTCASAPGVEYNTANPAPVTLHGGVTPVASEPLAAGTPYLLLANPEVAIAGLGAGAAAESVEVDCTLSGGPSASAMQTRAIKVDLGQRDQAQTLAFEVPVPATPGTVTAALQCTTQHTGTVSPVVTVATAIDAIQTASNTSEPYAG